MQYSPKLKTAMDRIKAILKEYDIAGSVVLHTPGFSEYLMKVDPSYSCAKLDGDMIRIKAKLQEDFAGNKTAQLKKIQDTVNMLSHFEQINGKVSIGMSSVLEVIKKTVDIDQTGGAHSSQTTQNN